MQVKAKYLCVCVYVGGGGGGHFLTRRVVGSDRGINFSTLDAGTWPLNVHIMGSYTVDTEAWSEVGMINSVMFRGYQNSHLPGVNSV